MDALDELDVLIAEVCAEGGWADGHRSAGEVLERVSARLELTDRQDEILWGVLHARYLEVLHRAVGYLSSPGHTMAEVAQELREELARAHGTASSR